MNEEGRLLALAWESISDFISNGDKQDAANALVDAFVEAGIDVEALFDAEGECNYLDRAMTANHDRSLAEEEEELGEMDDLYGEYDGD